MSDVDPHLLDQVLRRLAGHDLDGANPREIAKWVLGTLTIDSQWQSLAYDDCNGNYEDEYSKVYSTVEELLAALGTMPFSPDRHLFQRFVARTDWQQIQPRLEWE